MTAKPESPAGTPPSCPIRWFSDSQHLAELACLIDALPSHSRVPILQAALDFWPEEDLATSFLVGTFRTRLFDSLFERLGRPANVIAIRRIDRTDLELRLQPFIDAGDPAQVTLAACDLMNFLVEQLTPAKPRRPTKHDGE
jgi:hypothetical protein